MKWLKIIRAILFDRSLSLYISDVFEKYPLLQFSGNDYLKIHIENSSSIFPFILEKSSVAAYTTIDLFHSIYFKDFSYDLSLVNSNFTKKLYHFKDTKTLIRTECDMCLPTDIFYDLSHTIHFSSQKHFTTLKMPVEYFMLLIFTSEKFATQGKVFFFIQSVSEKFFLRVDGKKFLFGIDKDNRRNTCNVYSEIKDNYSFAVVLKKEITLAKVQVYLTTSIDWRYQGNVNYMLTGVNSAIISSILGIQT